MGTLTESLSKISEEKSRLEGSFQEDKKKMRQEIKDRDAKIKATQNELSALKSSSSMAVEEIKSRLIVERHEREKETGDHALTLRELQNILADERGAKDVLEAKLK